MKRRILLGVLACTAVFLAAGAALAARIHATTDDVGRTIRLHQVELLREGYLLELRAVQSDLLLQQTPNSRNPQTVLADMAEMGASIDRCFGCHHAAGTTSHLTALRSRTERYRLALAALPASPAAAPEARQAVLDAGEALIGEVGEMVDVAHVGLERHALAAMADLSAMKYAVYALALVAPLLAALVGLFVLAGLTRPLDLLVQATRRLKAGGLDHRVEGLQGEFRELATSFNEMAGSLQEQVQLMQRTEQLAVVGELAAGLVHEIKNPLAGIKAATQLLAQETSASAADREVLEKVAREVVGLESLLRAFLEFAKPVRPQLADVEVNGFVNSVAAFYLRSHGRKTDRPIRIAKKLGPVPPARADPMQLQQILLNLLLNAVEAMPNGGAIEVRTGFDAGAGRVHIEVADGGRGISEAHAPQVFSPFFTTKAGGTGLGLAVSKRLAEQHGGTLTFAPNPGGGTVFRVQLPPAAPGPSC